MKKPANLKIILYYLCLLELVLFTVLVYTRYRNPIAIELGPEDMTISETFEERNYVEGFWGLDHWLMPFKTTMRSGVYTVTINYTLNGPGVSHMTDSLYEYSMPRGADQQLTYDIYVADSQKPFSIVCRLAAGALDDDNLTVHNIHIATSRADLGNFALKLLGLFFLIDAVALLYIKREAIGNLSEEQRHVIVGLLAATFVLSLPYLSGFIYMQRDITFHMARIEGLKNGLLSGAFPVRIQPSWANSHGYAVSVFYGDLFLYPSALLRLAGIPMGFCYSFYVICVNFATLLIGYFCFKKMTNSTYIGLAVALVYAANIYRLMALNIRAAVGEYTAMAFFPLILYGFWAIYTPPPPGAGGGEMAKLQEALVSSGHRLHRGNPIPRHQHDAGGDCHRDRLPHYVETDLQKGDLFRIAENIGIFHPRQSLVPPSLP